MPSITSPNGIAIFQIKAQMQCVLSRLQLEIDKLELP